MSAGPTARWMLTSMLSRSLPDSDSFLDLADLPVDPECLGVRGIGSEDENLDREPGGPWWQPGVPSRDHGPPGCSESR